MQVPKPCLPSPGLDSVGLSRNQHFNTAQVILMGVDAYLEYWLFGQGS